MAKFECKVYEIKIKEHPNADSLELAIIEGYQAIIPKNKFKEGDKVIYIPEQAIVSEKILEEMNLTGRLAGKKANRVKAIKLRGIVSQGLIYPAKKEWELGQDVKEELKITKYIPEIPTQLSGEVDSWDHRVKFDIENIKNYPDVLKKGEEVIFTEKIHGTCTIASYIPEKLKNLRKDSMLDGKWAVTSKGLADRQLYLKGDQKDNLYIKSFNEKIRKMLELEFNKYKEIVTFFGESFGKVQDLRYGIEQGASFRMFGIKVGNTFWDFEKMEALCNAHGIEVVPILYRGKFSKEALEEYTKGKETVSGKELHIREGIVVYPKNERYSEGLGRVVFKSISEDYLFRKNGTEYN